MDIEAIWAQFGQQLKMFIKARVSDPHVADELSQELLIKSYKNIHSIKDKDRVDSWLFSIARNVVNDYYRKMMREENRNITDVDSLVASLQQDQDDITTVTELSQCVRPFIEQLSDKYRRTLTAVELEGYSQKELAEKLGVSHSTIKSQTQRARTQLNKLFKRCCEFSIDARGNVVGYKAKSSKNQCHCDC